MNITVLTNGDLKLTADNFTRSEIAEAMRRDRCFWYIMADLFEPYFTNGEYDPFDAGDANPFVGLTSAPCIAESLDYHDDGEKEIVGRFWYFPNYMLENPLETLKNTGRVIFAQP